MSGIFFTDQVRMSVLLSCLSKISEREKKLFFFKVPYYLGKVIVLVTELKLPYTFLSSAVRRQWAQPFPREQNRRAVTKKSAVA